MKIVFMGTPEFSVKTLEALIEKHEVLCVVTQPDKQKGRGKKLVCSPVKEVALKHNIPVFQPDKIRKTDFLKDFSADVFVVIAYGQILPDSILNIPKYGSINVHASLLPKYRGAAPIQWSIINGEKTTGITIMYMDKGLDTGDMILKRSVAIEQNETSETLHKKLSIVGSEALIEALSQIENNTAKREKQDDSLSTYAKMITKEDGHLDFNKTSYEIINLINGLNPWPSAYAFYNNVLIKFWKAEILEDYKEGKIGEVLDIISKKGFVIKTADSAILILELQEQGARRMNTPDYLRGHDIIKGSFFQ